MKCIFHLLIMITFVACISCSNSSVDDDSKSNNELNESINNELSETKDSLQLFWNEFRSAVMNEDSLTLMQLTQFPLNSHGILDDDPQISIGKDQFYYYFKICLNEQTGLSLDNETNFDYIKKVSILNEDMHFSRVDNWARISNFVFERLDGNWKLTQIYFDTREIHKH